MTIKRLMDMVQELTRTPVSDTVLLNWLSNCENTILTDVFLAAPESCTEYTAITENDLLVPHPFDKLYLPYMQAQIYHAAGEFMQYDAYMQLYNEYRDEYARYVLSTVNPATGEAVSSGYYLTAYAIAVAHGYSGSEEEWIRSLKGAKGEQGPQGVPGPQGPQGIPGQDADVPQWAKQPTKPGYQANEIDYHVQFLGEEVGTVDDALAVAEDAINDKIDKPEVLTWDAVVYPTLLDFLKTITVPGRYKFVDPIEDTDCEYELVLSTADEHCYFGKLQWYGSEVTGTRMFVALSDISGLYEDEDMRPATMYDVRTAINTAIGEAIGGEY